MKKLNYWDLDYWKTGEWQVIEERLKDHEQAGLAYVPTRDFLFASLGAISPGQVKVCILGQDPYPNPEHATGIAFSVPGQLGPGDLPPTLKNIFKEYQDDLGYPAPKNGDLTTWVNQGVLLWNAYPSFVKGEQRWDEWRPLTEEILRKLDGQGKTVFILLGSIARSFNGCISRSTVIQTSHPSPLGANKGFLGSRIFTRANTALVDLGIQPVDWRLPNGQQEEKRC